MTEYAGYIAVNPVDWSKVAREATKDIMAIEDERQKKREELDALSVAGQEEINKWTKSADSDMNNVLMAGAQSARSYIQAQNDLLKKGLITPEEYKRNIANVQMNFSLASRNVASFGDNIAKHEEMVLNGTASDQQIQNMKAYSKYTTMRNASIEIGADGNVFMKDTESKDGAIIPMGALSDPSNFFSKRIELAKYSDNFLKTLGLEKRYVQGRDIYIKSERLTEGLIEEGVDGLLGEDVNKYANVLTTNATDENGKILYTFDPEEAKRMNKTLIKQELGKDGKYYAILSDKQKQEARNVVRSSIMDRVTTEETGFGVGTRLSLQEQRLIDNMNAKQAKEYAKLNKEEQKEYLKKLKYGKKLDDRIAQINVVLGPGGLESSEGTSILRNIKVPNYKGKGVVKEIKKLGEDEYAIIYPDISYRATRDQTIAIINNAYNSTSGYDKIPATDIKNMSVNKQAEGDDIFISNG